MSYSCCLPTVSHIECSLPWSDVPKISDVFCSRFCSHGQIPTRDLQWTYFFFSLTSTIMQVAAAEGSCSTFHGLLIQPCLFFIESSASQRMLRYWRCILGKLVVRDYSRVHNESWLANIRPWEAKLEAQCEGLHLCTALVLFGKPEKLDRPGNNALDRNGIIL